MSDTAPVVADHGAPAPPEDYLQILSASEQLLDDVDQALVRIREGAYRTCEACGATIEEEHLVLHPATRRCTEHDEPSGSTEG